MGCIPYPTAHRADPVSCSRDKVHLTPAPSQRGKLLVRPPASKLWSTRSAVLPV